jgi:hypothetical protein
MANPLYGEAVARYGDGGELTLRFDFDAQCAVEDLADKPIDEVLAEMAGAFNPVTGKPEFRKPRMRTQARMLYGATRFHHPSLTITECQALVLQHNAEILWPMLSALGRAMGKGDEIDAAQEEGGGDDAADPPPSSAPGIGENSSTDGAPLDSTPAVLADKPQPLTQEP